MAPWQPGPLTNTVTTFADQGDRDETDNVARAVVTVATPPTTFSLTKKASRKVVKAGSTVKYTIRAKNTGKHAAANVRVCESPAPGQTFVKFKGGKLSRGRACWTVDYWKPGQTRTFVVVSRVNRDRTIPVVSQATLSAKNVKTPPRNTTVRVKGVGSQRGGGVTG